MPAGDNTFGIYIPGLGVFRALDQNEQIVVRTSLPRGEDLYKKHERARSPDPFVFLKLPIPVAGQPLGFLPEVNPQNLARLTMLGIHIQYGECQKHRDNLLMYGGAKSQHPMTKKDMQDLLQLGRQTYYTFLSDMNRAGVLFENDDGTFTLRDNLFIKGRLSKKEKNVCPVAKLSIKAYKSLYQFNPKMEKEIGTILRLAPFINRHRHILCWNPYEPEIDKIDVINYTDICRILGANTDNVTRYKKWFKSHVVDMMFSPTGSNSYCPACKVGEYRGGGYAIGIDKKLISFSRAG